MNNAIKHKPSKIFIRKYLLESIEVLKPANPTEVSELVVVLNNLKSLRCLNASRLNRLSLALFENLDKHYFKLTTESKNDFSLVFNKTILEFTKNEIDAPYIYFIYKFQKAYII